MAEKYVVIVPRGVLCFDNGEQVESGKVIPFNIPKDEKDSKIKRGLIALWDPEKAALSPIIQVEKNKNPDVEKAFKELTEKLEELTKDIQAVRGENAELKELCETLQKENKELCETLQKENKELKNQLEEMQTADLERQEENASLKADLESLKKGGKK